MSSRLDGDLSLQWTRDEEEAMRSLIALGELNPEEALSDLYIHGHEVEPQSPWLQTVIKTITFQWGKESGSTVHQQLQRLRPAIQHSFAILKRNLSLQKETQQPLPLLHVTAKVARITEALSRASKGLYSQILRHEETPKTRREIAQLILDIHHLVVQVFQAPLTQDNLRRALQESDPTLCAREVHRLSQAWKNLRLQCQQLRNQNAIPKGEWKKLEHIEAGLETIIKRAPHLLWGKAQFLQGATLRLSDPVKTFIAEQLTTHSETANPVPVLQQLFGQRRPLPKFTVNQRALELPQALRAHDYIHLMSMLLAGIDKTSILPVEMAQIEAEGKRLAAKLIRPHLLENSEKGNSEIVDFPAPTCVGVLMRTFQPLTFDGSLFLGPELSGRAREVAPSEALYQPHWECSIAVIGNEMTVTQSRDYILHSPDQSPVAYITLQSDLWRRSGKPWQRLAVRLSYIAFHRAATQSQVDEIVDLLPLTQKIKEKLRG